MDAFKIAVKLFAQQDVLEQTAFVPIFQRWIQNASLPGHLLIDVADYAHVVAGPGTVLVSSEANLATDRGDNRLGLLYYRKLPLEGSFRDKLRQVLAATFTAAELLEKEPSLAGRLKFRTDELLIRINDRLLAPSTTKTFEDVKGDLEATGGIVFAPARPTIDFTPAADKLFEVKLKSPQAPSLQSLLSRVTSPLVTA